MSKAEHTRNFIIEKTASIFNKNGFAGTSLSDITTATGLTKGSIYGNFKNKEEVAVAVFKHNTGGLVKKMEIDLASRSTALGKLQAFTDFYRNNWDFMLENGGCPLLNSAIEMDDALPFMKNSVQGSFTNLTQRISSIIEQGKAQGEFKQDTDSTQYASLFIMLVEGGILLSKTLESPVHLNQALDRISLIIREELSN